MSKKLNETTGYEIAGLIMDLMSKLRKGVILLEEFKNFLTMKTSERRKIFGIKTEHPKMKLIQSGIEIPELDGEFNPQEHFIQNKKTKYYFGGNFKKYVLDSSKKVSDISAMSFDKHKFTETIFDKEIMEHFQISESARLMTREEILRVIAYLTSKQPNGEAGELQINGYITVIGYILCDDGVVRAVCVCWRSGVRRWHCYCYDPNFWFAGNEVLSRN